MLFEPTGFPITVLVPDPIETVVARLNRSTILFGDIDGDGFRLTVSAPFFYVGRAIVEGLLTSQGDATLVAARVRPAADTIGVVGLGLVLALAAIPDSLRNGFRAAPAVCLLVAFVIALPLGVYRYNASRAPRLLRAAVRPDRPSAPISR